MKKQIIKFFILFFFFSITLFAQSTADIHYELLDKRYKEIDYQKSFDYLIAEFENYINIYPNSEQEDEALFRLAAMYAIRKNKPQQLFSLVKLQLLHGKSPLAGKVSQLIDSLITYDVELHLSESSEMTIKTLNNKIAKDDYRSAYIDFLSFLHSVQIASIDPLALNACNTYKLLFKNNQDMDAVLFWQADIYRRNKFYNRADFYFQLLRKQYKTSRFVPKALMELARLNINYYKQPDLAAD